MNEAFRKLAANVARIAGTPWAFVGALIVVFIWLLSGPIFGFSDTWQLVINTGTTIVTFLIVFLIQNTQNRDSRAIHIKLDELLKGVKGARNQLVNIEDVSDEELEGLHKDFQHLHQKYVSEIEKREGRKKAINGV